MRLQRNEVEFDRLDDHAGCLGLFHCGDDGAHDLGVENFAAAEEEANSRAFAGIQSSRVWKESLTIGIAPVGPHHHVKLQTRIGDVARHRTDIGICAEEIRWLQVRDRAERRLQADNPAAGGGNAD